MRGMGQQRRRLQHAVAPAAPEANDASPSQAATEQTTPNEKLWVARGELDSQQRPNFFGNVDSFSRH